MFLSESEVRYYGFMVGSVPVLNAYTEGFHHSPNEDVVYAEKGGVEPSVRPCGGSADHVSEVLLRHETPERRVVVRGIEIA